MSFQKKRKPLGSLGAYIVIIYVSAIVSFFFLMMLSGCLEYFETYACKEINRNDKSTRCMETDFAKCANDEKYTRKFYSGSKCNDIGYVCKDETLGYWFLESDCK